MIASAEKLPIRAAPGDNSRPLSVLAVTSELPWPLNSGGHLRTFHLLRALARQHCVRLVCAVTAGQEEALAVLQENGIAVCPARVEPREAWREAARALLAAARREPYVFYQRHNRWPVRCELRAQVCQEPADVLYLDHLDSVVFKTSCPHVPAVLDLHNVYATLAARAASERNTWLERCYLRREARLLARVEQRAVSEVAAVLSVSEDDKRHFTRQGGRNVHVVPNGVDCAAYAGITSGQANEPLVLYVGTMSWGPNSSAARYLAREVLPHVQAQVPSARLRIVGKDPPSEVWDLRGLRGVEVTGAVPDMRPHLAEAHVLAVPLEAGGGTRLKILEGFAAGLPVISTPIGCEGLSVVHGEHLVIAERAQFADRLLALLRDRAFQKRLRTTARTLVQEQYDWSIVGASACAAVASVVSPRRRLTSSPS